MKMLDKAIEKYVQDGEQPAYSACITNHEMITIVSWTEGQKN